MNRTPIPPSFDRGQLVDLVMAHKVFTAQGLPVSPMWSLVLLMKRLDEGDLCYVD